MAGEIQVNSVTALTESGSNIVLNNVDTATNRTNLGLGSMATQNATAVALTGGSVTGTEIDLKSSGTTLYASDGSTSLISESSGTVTVNNVTLGSSVSGIGQLIGMSFSNGLNANGNIVTLESSKSYDALLMIYSSGVNYYFLDLAYADVDSSGNVTVGKYTTFAALLTLQIPGGSTNQVQIKAYNSTHGYSRALIFERGSTFDAS
jgi:hypothetical protein